MWLQQRTLSVLAMASAGGVLEGECTNEQLAACLMLAYMIEYKPHVIGYNVI